MLINFKHVAKREEIYRIFVDLKVSFNLKQLLIQVI